MIGEFLRVNNSFHHCLYLLTTYLKRYTATKKQLLNMIVMCFYLITYGSFQM